jgi:hypothetical protein
MDLAIIGWGLLMLALGVGIGMSIDTGACSTSTSDGGVTYVETCVRDVTP